MKWTKKLICLLLVQSLAGCASMQSGGKEHHFSRVGRGKAAKVTRKISAASLLTAGTVVLISCLYLKEESGLAVGGLGAAVAGGLWLHYEFKYYPNSSDAHYR